MFHEAYEGQAPWDTGRPQPAVMSLLEAGVFKPELLDLGCGTGENTLHPVVIGQHPFGMTNPVYIDTDGNGKYDAPLAFQ